MKQPKGAHALTIVVEEIAAGVTQIRVDRSEHKNMLDTATLTLLLRSLAAVKSARIVTFRGSGSIFCTGVDSLERSRMSLLERVTYNRLFYQVMSALEDLPMPTIAKVYGPAFGIGLELALACDLRFAAKSATFGWRDVSNQDCSSNGHAGQHFQAIDIPRARARIPNGLPIDAETAEDIGLIADVICDRDLEPYVLQICSEIANRPSEVIEALKRSLRARHFR